MVNLIIARSFAGGCVVILRAVELGQTCRSGFNTPTIFVIANDLTKMQIDYQHRREGGMSARDGAGHGMWGFYGLDGCSRRVRPHLPRHRLCRCAIRRRP